MLQYENVGMGTGGQLKNKSVFHTLRNSRFISAHLLFCRKAAPPAGDFYAMRIQGISHCIKKSSRTKVRELGKLLY